jgi:small subunit ribosomal protein S4
VVRHNGILVNGKRVNIPSYQVPAGRRGRSGGGCQGAAAHQGASKPRNRAVFPEWIEVDAKALKGTFKARPQRSDLPSTINESLVVELYSK